MKEKRDESISAMATPAIGEAGKTGGWRDMRPHHDPSKCIPCIKKKASCFLCWLYCPEGVIKATIPPEINLEYCKGCGICAEECPAKAIVMVHEEENV